MDTMLDMLTHHFHNPERWLAAATTPSGETHRADLLNTKTTSLDAFQINAGNNAFGAWTQVIGSSDTPLDVGNQLLDVHRILITASQRSTPYLIQIGFGTVSAGVLTGVYTAIPYAPTGTNGEQAALEVRSPRVAVGTKVWARALCPGANLGTVDFLLGLHEYNEAVEIDIHEAVWNSVLEYYNKTGVIQSAKAWEMLQAIFSSIHQRLKAKE